MVIRTHASLKRLNLHLTVSVSWRNMWRDCSSSHPVEQAVTSCAEKKSISLSPSLFVFPLKMISQGTGSLEGVTEDICRDRGAQASLARFKATVCCFLTIFSMLLEIEAYSAEISEAYLRPRLRRHILKTRSLPS